MRMQIRQLTVTLVWAGVLLLFALALLSFLPRAQPATFQNGSPTVEISLNNYEGKVPHGQSVAQYTFRDFQSITCDKNGGYQHSTAFDDPCYHRSEVYERGTTNRVSQCERGWGGDRSFSKGTGISKVIRYGQNMVPSTCPVGLYTLKVILMGSARDEVATATEPISRLFYRLQQTRRRRRRQTDRYADGDGDTDGHADGDGDTDRYADAYPRRRPMRRRRLPLRRRDDAYTDGHADRRRPIRLPPRRPRRQHQRQPQTNRRHRIRRKIPALCED